MDNSTHGVVVHYQDPENWMGVGLARTTGTALPTLYRRQNGVLSIVALGTAVTMTDGDRVRVAIHDDIHSSSESKTRSAGAAVSRSTSAVRTPRVGDGSR